MDKINYYVIGGQYERYNHGGAATLLSAKRLAAKNDEYWDNWQGWHRPTIYAAADCEKMRNFYGTQVLPKVEAQPVATWDGKKWVDG